MVVNEVLELLKFNWTSFPETCKLEISKVKLFSKTAVHSSVLTNSRTKFLCGGLEKETTSESTRSSVHEDASHPLPLILISKQSPESDNPVMDTFSLGLPCLLASIITVDELTQTC
ncbi:hypothetical protein JCM19314_2511 [Nonlabens ulvanivorans]|uniref:Uncharacterized protein n=1 Tax=Nonlabens ulvanivorans TaxID=906888 RepID=A0A090Q694_NONUL|nr:hypothetical protein JCM19314_2511 [Nonlabens ulvanivorans]